MMQASTPIMSPGNQPGSITQTLTQTNVCSPISVRGITPIAKSPEQPPDNERQCWNICRDRFKYVIFASAVMQYLLLMIYSIILDISFLNPLTWFREFFWILCSPLMVFTVVHGYFKLKPYLEEKVYHPTKFSKFTNCFTHESSILALNFCIGLFTSLMFVRYLHDDFKTLTVKTEEKRFLNEKFAFLIFSGAFVRCFFYFKRRDFEQNITFPLIHHSKLLQIRRQFFSALKASFFKSLTPTIHFLGVYLVFGGSFCFFLRKLFFLNAGDTSLLESFTIILNVRLFVYSWILSSLIWSNMELMTRIIDIFATEPRAFPIDGGLNVLTLSEALGLSKFRITQQLAAQDLLTLAEHPNNARRKQFYMLSNPGGHPNNWKNLVKKSLQIINQFTDEIKKSLETSCKNNNTAKNNLNQSMYHFIEGKRIVRDHNAFSGVRNLAPTPLTVPPPVEQKPSFITVIKQKLLTNKLIFFFFGETDESKLIFVVNENSQVLIWTTQGIAALISRSLQEDSYGVVQSDIKQILKSFIKLKTVLDKVGTFNSIAKDRNFLALKSAIRRSLYRITSDFAPYFEDLLLDPEDLRALSGFTTFRECLELVVRRAQTRTKSLRHSIDISSHNFV